MVTFPLACSMLYFALVAANGFSSTVDSLKLMVASCIQCLLCGLGGATVYGYENGRICSYPGTRAEPLQGGGVFPHNGNQHPNSRSSGRG